MSERIDLTQDMGHAPIGKLIFKMSLPSIIGVMAYNVYNLFDTIFISQGAGMDALGGVAVSFPLFLFLSAISSTLGGGAASVMSRAFGEDDRELPHIFLSYCAPGSCFGFSQQNPQSLRWAARF